MPSGLPPRRDFVRLRVKPNHFLDIVIPVAQLPPEFTLVDQTPTHATFILPLGWTAIRRETPRLDKDKTRHSFIHVLDHNVTVLVQAHFYNGEDRWWTHLGYVNDPSTIRELAHPLSHPITHHVVLTTQDHSGNDKTRTLLDLGLTKLDCFTIYNNADPAKPVPVSVFCLPPDWDGYFSPESSATMVLDPQGETILEDIYSDHPPYRYLMIYRQ